jgi:hypothetical protein
VSTPERLRAVLLEEGEPLSSALRSAPLPDVSDVARVAASGPRAAGDPGEYELLVEAIHEGYLLHYASPRLIGASDENLALLAGDRLYALGLERLVALGDLEAVRELADVITLCALLTARGEGASCEALWLAAARAVGFGASSEHERVKALLRNGDPAAAAALAALTGPHALA